MSALDDALAGRELFGVRLGLERMRALLGRLDDPQRCAPAIHVVGTNGKTSTTRFCGAILTAHGLRTGTYVSPHIAGFAERVEVDGAPIGEQVLLRAVERTDEVARDLDRVAPDDPVTQFELLTAAAFVAFAGAGVAALVVEAGLGGRHDATNVLAAPVVVLTSVGLDHVEQLGPTRAAIAAEKLAVLAPAATLVAGSVDAELADILDAHGHRGPTVRVDAGAADRDVPQLAARGAFQRHNATLALRASEAFLGLRFDRARALAAVAATIVPGRLQQIGEDPLVIVDGAHNPEGAATLRGELAEALAGRSPRIGVLAVLRDKDVDGIVTALEGAFDGVIATATSSGRALPAADLAARAGRIAPADVVTPPAAALRAACERAGEAGAVVVCGSLSLLADLAPEIAGAR